MRKKKTQECFINGKYYLPTHIPKKSIFQELSDDEVFSFLLLKDSKMSIRDFNPPFKINCTLQRTLTVLLKKA